MRGIVGEAAGTIWSSAGRRASGLRLCRGATGRVWSRKLISDSHDMHAHWQIAPHRKRGPCLSPATADVESVSRMPYCSLTSSGMISPKRPSAAKFILLLRPAVRVLCGIVVCFAASRSARPTAARYC